MNRLRQPFSVLVAGVALLGTWQYASASFNLKFWISSPTAVATLAVSWMTEGYIWHHVQATVEAVAIGYAGGAALAVLGAFLAFTWAGAFRVVYPYFMALYTIPKIALAPMLIVVFGIDIWSKVALVVVTTLFICFYQCLSGLNAVPNDMINQVRLMGASKLEVYRDVLLPASRDWVILALRLAFPKAISAAIIGEIIASNRGLGYVTRYQSAVFSTTGVLTAIAFILLLALPVYYLLDARAGRGPARDIGGAV